jgi:hypothetical protein
MAELPIENLRVMVSQAADLTAQARAESEKARDYYDGHQWTAQEIAVLQRRKQPVITTNRIQRKIDAMVGLEQRGRTDPRALPRTPEKEELADVATKVLVFVDDQTRFDMIRTDAFANVLIEGYGGVEIAVEERGGKLDVVINRLRWEEIIFDPHSREKDFSDAGYVGVQKWMTLDQALEAHAETWLSQQPEGTDRDEAIAALEELLQATLGGTLGETYDDRPQGDQGFQWGDKRQKRVRVAQMYYRRAGVWYLAIFTGGGTIINQPSPYLDENGRPSCPMVLMTAYIDRENRRYGLVRTMLSMQDEINKRRSKSLHLLNSRQTWGLRGAVDVQRMKAEKASADGHIEINPDLASELGGRLPFGDLSNVDQTAGHFQLLTEAKNEIDALGPNASLQGQLQGAQSGRAIIAQQQAGLAELAPIYDQLRDWTIRCYRQMWLRVQQFWTDERYVRITDDVQATEFLQVNKIVGMQPAMDPQTGQIVMQPIMENVLAELDVDIIVDESPDYGLLRHEQFEQLTQMAQAGIPIPPEMLIEYSNLRDKKRILEAMQQMQQGAMQAQAQQAEQAAQIEQAKVQAQVITAQARAQKDVAQAAKTQAETPKAQAESEASVSELAVRRAVMGF